jgi:hypothetical protein
MLMSTMLFDDLSHSLNTALQPQVDSRPTESTVDWLLFTSQASSSNYLDLSILRDVDFAFLFSYDKARTLNWLPE